jgi:hypothetical protein
MNCASVRALLVESLGDDLPAEQRSALETHLAGCADCRRERATLAHVCRLLDATPAPVVQVDVAAIHAEAARREARRARRWRRLSVGVGLAASILLVVSVWRMELRVEGHQVTLRWGAPPPAPQPLGTDQRHDDRGIEEKVKLLSDLVQALAVDVQMRDVAQQEAVARLQARLTQALNEASRSRAVSEQDISTLTQFVQTMLREKGGQP